jgi:hypothetical protein
MTGVSHSPRRRGFVVRRLEDLVPRSHAPDWDVRFVASTLLFYGLVGTSFLVVDWLNPSANDESAASAELAAPAGDGSPRVGSPYLLRLPQLRKDRDAAGDPMERR